LYSDDYAAIKFTFPANFQGDVEIRYRVRTSRHMQYAPYTMPLTFTDPMVDGTDPRPLGPDVQQHYVGDLKQDNGSSSSTNETDPMNVSNGFLYIAAGSQITPLLVADDCTPAFCNEERAVTGTDVVLYENDEQVMMSCLNIQPTWDAVGPRTAKRNFVAGTTGATPYMNPTSWDETAQKMTDTTHGIKVSLQVHVEPSIDGLDNILYLCLNAAGKTNSSDWVQGLDWGNPDGIGLCADNTSWLTTDERNLRKYGVHIQRQSTDGYKSQEPNNTAYTASADGSTGVVTEQIKSVVPAMIDAASITIKMINDPVEYGRNDGKAFINKDGVYRAVTAHSGSIEGEPQKDDEDVTTELIKQLIADNAQLHYNVGQLQNAMDEEVDDVPPGSPMGSP